MDGHFQVEAALEARTDFVRSGSAKAEHLPWRTTILLSAGCNLAARSFVALFAQAQIWRGKSKKAPFPAHDSSKRLLPGALKAFPEGNLLTRGMDDQAFDSSRYPEHD
jgi:hypothetical protein